MNILHILKSIQKNLNPDNKDQLSLIVNESIKEIEKLRKENRRLKRKTS